MIKGERAIRMWAPCPPSRKTVERWERYGGVEEQRPRMRWRLAAVFAQDQATLEVYAQVQQRLSRKEVHQAFDDLLASAAESVAVPTEGREKMSRSTSASSPQGAELGSGEGAEVSGGPRKWSTN